MVSLLQQGARKAVIKILKNFDEAITVDVASLDPENLYQRPYAGWVLWVECVFTEKCVKRTENPEKVDLMEEIPLQHVVKQMENSGASRIVRDLSKTVGVLLKM